MSHPVKPDAATVETALAAWMIAHPAAGLGEIEQEVDRQLRGLRAALIAETAQLGEAGLAPVCPTCGAVMQRDGRETITQTTAQAGVLVIEGQRWRCPGCGAGLSPPR